MTVEEQRHSAVRELFKKRSFCWQRYISGVSLVDVPSSNFHWWLSILVFFSFPPSILMLLCIGNFENDEKYYSDTDKSREDNRSCCVWWLEAKERGRREMHSPLCYFLLLSVFSVASSLEFLYPFPRTRKLPFPSSLTFDRWWWRWQNGKEQREKRRMR